MHGLSAEQDLSFLLGKELDAIRIAVGQVQLVFSDELKVDCAAGLTLNNEKGSLAIDPAKPQDTCPLLSLLGLAVKSWRIEGKGDLVLCFDSTIELSIRDLWDRYESYVIWNGNDVIAV